MTTYASRVQRVAPSATLTINAKATELKAQGYDVISLAAGEPDFPPPPHVLEAAQKAAQQGKAKYTPVSGIPDLLQAVVDYYATFHSLSASPDMAIVTNGGKQALFQIFQVLLDPGDEVLIPAPYWVSYPDMVQLNDGRPIAIPSRAENNFLLQREDLMQHLGPSSKVLVLNTPSNPTGCHYSQPELDEIVSLALEKGLFIVADEIYDQLVYPPSTASSLAKWLEQAPEQVAIVNGLSKSFAIPGWRVGYALSHPALIKNLSKVQGQLTSNVCSLAQEAALAALTGPFDFVETSRQRFKKRRDEALKKISGWSRAVCPQPDGAFYLFPKVEAYYTERVPDSTSLCTYLLEKAGVALVPGAAFGDDSCVRLSYAVEDSVLLEALDSIGKALEEL